MPKILQHRRDTTSGLANTLGAEGEFFYDTETKTIVVMDGTTTGGTVLAKQQDVAEVSSTLATVSSDLFTILSAPATDTTLGLVKPDATSIVIVGDALSVSSDLTLSSLTVRGSKVGGLRVSAVVLTTGTTYTPNPNLAQALVIATGGGGGGGGSDGADTGSGSGGGGGGAGGTAIRTYTLGELGSTVSYAIGAAGGAGANTGTAGTTGGTTTFTPSGAGTVLTANGGGVGGATGAPAVGAAVYGGPGGAASGGIMNILGGDGDSGVGDDVAEISIGGGGGASYWGGGGAGGTAQAAGLKAGLDAEAFGSGGGGGAAIDTTVGGAGGVGKAGVIYILEYLTL
jgi:hypothetical protein